MNKKLWFKAKEYGWGWYPATWQGWLCLVVYIALDFLIFMNVEDRIYSVKEIILHFLLPLAILTTLLLYICYKKGEKPGWRWGGK